MSITLPVLSSELSLAIGLPTLLPLVSLSGFVLVFNRGAVDEPVHMKFVAAPSMPLAFVPASESETLIVVDDEALKSLLSSLQSAFRGLLKLKLFIDFRFHADSLIFIGLANL